jgi:hypothetical protein
MARQRFMRCLLGPGAVLAAGVLISGCGLASGPDSDGEVTLTFLPKYPRFANLYRERGVEAMASQDGGG